MEYLRGVSTNFRGAPALEVLLTHKCRAVRGRAVTQDRLVRGAGAHQRLSAPACNSCNSCMCIMCIKVSIPNP